EHELGDGRGGHRLHEVRTRADDAAVLRFGADHEAAHVLHEEDGEVLAVGGLDEVRHLLGAAGVHDAPERGRSSARPLITPRWLAMTATGHPSTCAWPQIISRATPGWNSSSAPPSR